MPKPLIDFEGVKGLLKQRFPMLMVDCVTELEPGKSIKAIKNVTGNEPHLQGHFPEIAVMPGTLIVEAIGQAACILFAKSTGIGGETGEFLVLGSIQNMRFVRPVRPGDRLDMEVKILKIVNDLALVEGSAKVGDEPVASGMIGFGRRKM